MHKRKRATRLHDRVEIHHGLNNEYNEIRSVKTLITSSKQDTLT